MNTGEMPEGMTPERRDLIGTLESLGYDTLPGIQKDWANWREVLADDQLRVIIANLSAKQDLERAAAAEAQSDELNKGDGTELPDISELVAAIDEIVASRDAFSASMNVEDCARQDRAYDRCRELQKQIAKAQEHYRKPLIASLTTSQPIELAEICKELGCTTKPGVALRFVKELRRDLGRAHERHGELLHSWDQATPTERQELDRLRRGWGPSTPTERMARRTDLREANSVIERAMDAVAPDSKADEDLTVDHFQSAYEKLSEGHRAIIAHLHAIPALQAPDLPDPAPAEPFPQPDRNRAGKEPCGECHIQPGETCCICGAFVLATEVST